MQTWKLEIEYAGTRYRGWQKQQNARSVQEEIENAARFVFQTTKIEVGGAGRTDAGVHALDQVAHLRLFIETPEDLTPRRLQIALNDKLPHDIGILRLSNAPRNFHARHDAVSRFYLYQISTRRTAFGKDFVWVDKRSAGYGFNARNCQSFCRATRFSLVLRRAFRAGINDCRS